MKKFIVKALLFGIPFYLYAAAMVLVDPFNYFSTTCLIVPNSVKQAVSGRLNYALWKMVDFRRHPTPNAYFGDSRMEGLDDATVEREAGERYANLALGGGTLPEAIKMFDFAAEEAEAQHVPLRSVYMGISFDMYDATNADDRVAGTRVLLDQPLMYIFNRSVLYAAWRVIDVTYFGASADIERPPMTREEFWRHQLGPVMRQKLERYLYPEQQHDDLVRITDYCRTHGVDFTVVVPPTHVVIQRRIEALGRQQECERFRRDVGTLARVFDFDHPTRLTRPEDNFADPFHLTPAVQETLIHEIWGAGGKPPDARVYGPGLPSIDDDAGAGECRRSWARPESVPLIAQSESHRVSVRATRLPDPAPPAVRLQATRA